MKTQEKKSEKASKKANLDLRFWLKHNIQNLFFNKSTIQCSQFFVHKTSRPLSRVLSWTVIHLELMSPSVSSNLPGNPCGPQVSPASWQHVPLFGFAPGGVYPAVNVTTNAVRSYRTLSPLPCKTGRYTFCCTGRGITPPRCYLAPCPLEPGLSSP